MFLATSTQARRNSKSIALSRYNLRHLIDGVGAKNRPVTEAVIRRI